MKNKIELTKGQFRINGKPFFIFSGEIHYFRILHQEWEDRIKKAKEAGLNTVSSYIPWRWHEPKEGRFDFTGKTKGERNLLKFIALLKKYGLYFFCRPGPITHGEMKNNGLPAWLVENYPEILLRRKDGSILDQVSYLNPTYLNYVKKWYAKILPLIAKAQITNGGNIVMVQLDNEISMINWLAKQFDYSETATKFYRDFLKEKYRTIANLNSAYENNYTSFEELEQPDGHVQEDEMMRYWDWASFCRRFYALYYKRLADMARKFKINVPLVANIAQFIDYSTCGRGTQGIMTTSMFRDFKRYVPDVIFGGAYQMRRLDFENFHDVAILTETIKMITTPGIPSICVELQTGIMNDRPRLYPSDVDLNLKASAANGLNGLNCYMFCGGKNPKDFGFRGSYHEWQAPIASDGKERAHLKPIKEFGKFLKDNASQLSSMQKASDLTIGVYLPYYMTEYLRGQFIDKITGLRDFLFFDGMARLLLLAGFNYSFVDLERSPLKDLKKLAHLLVFSLDFMDKDTQMKLAEYVKGGGKLILYYQVPEKDLSFKPENYLMNFLGIEGIAKSKSNLIYFDGKDCFVEGETSILKTKNAKVLAKTVEENKPCAIKKKIGKGEILIIGFGLPHILDYHIDVVSKLCRELGLNPSTNAPPSDLHIVKRENESGSFSFIFNYHDEPHNIRINSRDIKLDKRSAIIVKTTKLKKVFDKIFFS